LELARMLEVSRMKQNKNGRKNVSWLKMGLLVVMRDGTVGVVTKLSDDGWVCVDGRGWYVQKEMRLAGAVARKNYRLAKGRNGVERPWTKSEKYHLFMLGWRDGAGAHAMRKDHEDVQEYERGYQTGHEARRLAAAGACKRLRYTPSILRLAEEKELTS
jgi:hypothetical protein